MQNITLNSFQANILIEIETILNNTGYFGEAYVIQKAVITYLLENNITSGNQEQIVNTILSVLFNINVSVTPTPTIENDEPTDNTPTLFDPGVITNINTIQPGSVNVSAGGLLGGGRIGTRTTN
jgi:hypothetical protein